MRAPTNGWRPRSAGKRRLRGGDQRGISAIEIMLAVVLLSTAILGAAAAQASGWRVLLGSRLDAGAWAALHYQVEELVAGGFDRVSSGSRVLNGYPIDWNVAGIDPKVVLVVARYTSLGAAVADTVRVVLRPDPAP